ncbi:MAG: beta-ketoacyl-ACP synthase III [Neisseria sp.]|nr:beta-ketoacyl-ACP synthase III [Neisseria sp.]
MEHTLSDVYITRTAAFLPGEPIGNQDMETVLGKVGALPSRVRERILRANGITTRHYAIDPVSRAATHTCAELTVAAVRRLFQNGTDKNAVSLLACATSYPDQIMPGHGVMVHGLLNDTPPYEVASLSGVCAAGMAAMKYACNSVRCGEHEHAIAVAAETASAVMRREAFQGAFDEAKAENFTPELAFEKDFLRWMLSDGAGAVCLSNRPADDAPSCKVLWIDLISYANEMPVCMYAGGEVQDGAFVGWKSIDADERQARNVMNIQQDVKSLNANIVGYALEKALTASLKKHPITAQEIDYFLPHYSSGYFRDKVYQGLCNIGFEIPYEKWFTNLPAKGNTGSASIYIMLDEFLRTVKPQSGQKILCFVPESGRFSSAFMLLEMV